MKNLTLLILAIAVTNLLFGQQFEEPKFTGDTTKNVKVKIGADFALQYQALSHYADDTTLIPLGAGINLPTANLNIDGQLAKGIKVNLVTYLSSRHHTEAWVKGGYLLIDRMPFFNSAFIDKLMDFLTVKVGVDEIDYGDEHYRRSDNGNVIRNPFVGNYVMDAFTTAPDLEVMFRNKGVIALVAATTANLDPTIAGYNATTQTYSKYNLFQELAYYGKVGYDKQFTGDFRLRATLSGLYCDKTNSGTLYGGDRTGSRYYLVMKPETFNASDVDPTSNHLSGNFSPGFYSKDQSFMFNLFTKIKGFEFFGTYEDAAGTGLDTKHFNYWQAAAEGLYRFGKKDQFYGALRYDYVANNTSSSVGRVQAGAGWFLTSNIIAKVEYVNQMDKKVSFYGDKSGFKGLMVEAAISF